MLVVAHRHVRQLGRNGGALSVAEAPSTYVGVDHELASFLE